MLATVSVVLYVSVEELECLATWKEGSSRYLVGRLHHGHASSNEDRYRCFVYEKAGQTVQSNLHRAAMGIGAMDHDVGLQSGPVPEGAAEIYRVAQSGDATCNGLFSPMEGSRTMTLMKGTSSSFFSCNFRRKFNFDRHYRAGGTFVTAVPDAVAGTNFLPGTFV